MRIATKLGLSVSLALGCGMAAAQELPPAADKQVDFKADIWPIFEAKCIECHGAEKKKSGLRMHNKEEAMKGGTEGPMVVAGNSAESLLIQLVAGTNDNFDRMPPEGDPLSAEQIGLLRAWIDQGANWPDDFANPETTAPAPAPESAPAPENSAAPAESHPETGSIEGMAEFWKVEATKQNGPLAKWEIVPDVQGPTDEPVFGVTKVEHTAIETFNILWTDKLQLKDGAISIHLKPVSGETDQGGGIIWRVKDKNNYYVARYNPKEGNLRVYKVVNGEREQLASADAKVEKEWIPLRVEASGQHYKAILDGTVTVEGDDATFTEAGGAGFWTKADAATLFGGAAVEMTAS